jgi:hypothetical protein
MELGTSNDNSLWCLWIFTSNIDPSLPFKVTQYHDAKVENMTNKVEKQTNVSLRWKK